jgi:hypothetical protein
MKTENRLIITVMLMLIVCACNSDMDDMANNNSVAINGPFKVVLTGDLVRQSGTNTTGMVQIVEDNSGAFFVRLSENFNTKFSTNTVTVYLSTSATLRLNESGSFEKIGGVNRAGEHFYKLDDFPEEKFTHGIIWCGAAGIPFGNALLN